MQGSTYSHAISWNRLRLLASQSQSAMVLQICSVISLSIVKGVGTPQIAPTKRVQFSGYDWRVRTIASDWGGLNNLYDGDNAWTDANGALHLRIKKKAGRWSCADLAVILLD